MPHRRGVTIASRGIESHRDGAAGTLSLALMPMFHHLRTPLRLPGVLVDMGGTFLIPPLGEEDHRYIKNLPKI